MKTVKFVIRRVAKQGRRLMIEVPAAYRPFIIEREGLFQVTIKPIEIGEDV
jgi:hypothetical protein